MNPGPSAADPLEIVKELSVGAPYSFRSSATRFLAFVDEMNRQAMPPASAAARHAMVVVSPWVSCPVPWFAVTLGHLMQLRGIRVTLLVNDCCDAPDSAAFDSDLPVIREVLARLRGFETLTLSSMPESELRAEDLELVRVSARANAIWNNRGSLPKAPVDALERALEPKLRRNLPHVLGLFATRRFDYVVVPGGMYGNSGLFSAIGARHGIRVSTFDSGTGCLLVANDGAAARQHDIGRCVAEAESILGSAVDAARSKARQHLAERRSGGERYFTDGGNAGVPVQVVGANEDTRTYGRSVVLPLNVEWDTAAVGLHRFYRDDVEWLDRTVSFLLAQGDIDVVVRQHPATRIYTAGAQAMADSVRSKFGANPRFRFIAADEAVNSYRLLESASVVLPLSSTVGVEAAMLGKPIVMESHAYYVDLPFVISARDEETYFQRILEQARAPRPSTPDQVASAELTYFFAAVVNVVPTSFTPTPDDFGKWVTRGLDRLLDDPDVDAVVRSFVDAIPIAALRAHCYLPPSPEDPEENASQVSSTPAGAAALTGALRSIRARVASAPPLVSAPVEPSRAVAVVPNAERGPESRSRFPNVTLGDGVQIIGVRNVEIGRGSCIGDHVWLNVCDRDSKTRMRIGVNVLVGRQSMVSTGGYLEIGDHCLFGPRCSVVDADHGIEDIHRPYGEQAPTLGRSIVIEENCWLGAGAVVAGNLTVGRGSVIGANAVVSKDVEPFSIVAGNPARLVKLYDPVTKRWERVGSDEERARVDEHRRASPLPDRAAYREILRRNSRTSQVIPIVAGRGEWL
ncbi:MAG: hypothetical protein FJ096_03055 [Deltaproteobacteria bacterium]|nr:hypothetical protein [Deltaproteobacteria bacterium]